MNNEQSARFDPKEMQHRAERSKVEHFDNWMDKAEVKMLISLLPSLETDVHRGCFRALMQSAFVAGHDSGGSVVATTMLQAMLISDRNHNP
jgi:hypothetical protein